MVILNLSHTHTHMCVKLNRGLAFPVLLDSGWTPERSCCAFAVQNKTTRGPSIGEERYAWRSHPTVGGRVFEPLRLMKERFVKRIGHSVLILVLVFACVAPLKQNPISNRGLCTVRNAQTHAIDLVSIRVIAAPFLLSDLR